MPSYFSEEMKEKEKKTNHRNALIIARCWMDGSIIYPHFDDKNVINVLRESFISTAIIGLKRYSFLLRRFFFLLFRSNSTPQKIFLSFHSTLTLSLSLRIYVYYHYTLYKQADNFRNFLTYTEKEEYTQEEPKKKNQTTENKHFGENIKLSSCHQKQPSTSRQKNHKSLFRLLTFFYYFVTFIRPVTNGVARGEKSVPEKITSRRMKRSNVESIFVKYVVVGITINLGQPAQMTTVAKA